MKNKTTRLKEIVVYMPIVVCRLLLGYFVFFVMCLLLPIVKIEKWIDSKMLKRISKESKE